MNKEKLKKQHEDILEKILGLEQSRRAIQKSLNQEDMTNKQEFLHELGRELVQIESALDRMKKYPILIRSTHRGLKRAGINEIEQLRFYIQNYLNSVYIFDERIENIFNFLRKYAHRNGVSRKLVKNIKKRKNVVQDFLSNIRKVRGRHVHERDFVDEEINDLSITNLVITEGPKLLDDLGEDSQEIKSQKAILKLQIKNKRKEWREKVENNNQNCIASLGYLYPIIDKARIKIYRAID